jgi:LEA14-like dessication related protein
MNMARRYYSVLIFILALLVFASGCSAIFKEPVVTVNGIGIDEISASDLTLNLSLSIDNPNFFGVTLSEIVCNVSYLKGNDEWAPLSSVRKENVTINPGMNTLTIPIYAKNVDLLKAGVRALVSGEITIKATGYARPSFLGFTPAIPFSQTQTIPLENPVSNIINTVNKAV